EPAGMDERVGLDQIEKVGMQPGRQPRRVVVPVEDIEGGRRIAEQVVVHPVVHRSLGRIQANMRASSRPSTTPANCEALFAAMILPGLPNNPAVVFCVAAMSGRQTATVALWTLLSPRAARCARNADMVMPPEHEPQTLTSALPVMSRITSTASSSAPT